MGKKKRIGKLRTQKNNSSKMKMSELIINYASDYIELGNTLEEKQSHLNAACSAWNITLLKKDGRQKALDNFIEHYKEINPDADDTGTDDVRHDMELLIKEKMKLYPDVKRPVAEARIINDNGQERIIVKSV
jgi:hypothetical protein